MSDRCDREIFENGAPLLLADTGPVGGAKKFEVWVQELARLSGQRVDWHYSGGIAQVLFIGCRDKLVKVAESLELPEHCQILRWCDNASSGLYRAGVTEVPEGTVGGFIDPLTGKQTFMVEK